MPGDTRRAHVGAGRDAECDVAIVGYGPTGATLAGLLGRAGLRVVVIDKAREVYAQPRAVGFDHDAMRIFQRMGAAHALAPHLERFRETVYLGADGAPIQRVRPLEPPWPLAWAPNYTCDQPGVETVLRECVAAMPNVDVRLGVECTGITAHARGVTIELDESPSSRETVHGDRGAPRRPAPLHASWLVACDGATGRTRRWMDVALESQHYDAAWIVVDVRVHASHLGRLPVTNVQYCRPERPSTYVVCPGDHRRWEFMVLEGESGDELVDEARLWRLLSPWLAPGEARIWRAAAYRFHALVATPWRRGRVLLAGDAAHQTPPFLGQGMCQGIRDAGNLAWKLEHVIRARAPEALLDSYEAERRPHVIETTRIATAFGRMMSERDPAQARERDAQMRDARGGVPTILRQSLIPGLAHGLLAHGAPCAGEVFPQPRVDAPGAPDVLFDDCFGERARVVVDASARTSIAERVVERAVQRGLHAAVMSRDAAPASSAHATVVRERGASLAGWFDAARCSVAVVRPDGYVFGAARTVADALSLVDAYADRLALTHDTAVPMPGG